jgi:uncharacterized protein (DUF58 family)
MSEFLTSTNADWFGPGARPKRWRDIRIARFLLGLFIPPKGQKVVPTKAGLVLLILALSIGVAAYHTASNVLFIALSLLLATIILSGMLSLLNFRRTAWRITLQPPFRVNQPAVIGLEVHNAKGFLPTYSLAFQFRASSGDDGRLVLRHRLDPGDTRRMEWSFTPRHRGRELIEMAGVGSEYPFGFLNKHFGGRIEREVFVWPARVAYEASLSAMPAPNSVGEVLNRAGAGNDFVNLRRYQLGDSVRHIHWKATARQRKLMVRQLLAENHSGFYLHVESPATVWHRPEQFEQLCSLAATLAEDLFRSGQLVGAIINDHAPLQIRRVTDLDLFLDQLAVLETVDYYQPGRGGPGRNVISFEPGNPDGVHACIRGQKAASA